MNDGERVLLWIEDNGHKVGEIAQIIGYSRQALSTALNQNQISEKLARALYEHFYLRVSPTPISSKTGRGPGGLKAPRPSKLDAFADEIKASLKAGLTQGAIAKKFNCKLVIQKNNGYGSAIIEGFKNANNEFGCIFNADHSFDPKYLDGLVKESEKNDLIAKIEQLKQESKDFAELSLSSRP